MFVFSDSGCVLWVALRSPGWLTPHSSQGRPLTRYLQHWMQCAVHTWRLMSSWCRVSHIFNQVLFGLNPVICHKGPKQGQNEIRLLLLNYFFATAQLILQYLQSTTIALGYLTLHACLYCICYIHELVCSFLALTHCVLVQCHLLPLIWVNNWLHYGTKPLTYPMLTYHQ